MEHRPLKAETDAREHLVVIGNGMAGCRAIEELLARDPTRYRVTIFGAEPRINYNRIMLSPVLAGEKSFDDIVINDAGWYADNGIALVAGDPVARIDRDTKTVTTRGGLAESYDRLLIATGSEGRDLSGIGCRENGCWAQERTAAGRKAGEYRQVSSGDLTAAAAAMMPGNPFDAAAERAAWGA